MKELYQIAAAGMIGLTLLAQNVATPPAGSATSTAIQTTPAASIDAFNRASSVIGMSVKDSSGKVLGKVQDLVFDLESSKLGYAVLAVGESRIVPIPITALKRGESQDHFVLNMNPSLLAAASGIQNDDWPNVDTFAVGAPAQSETGRGKSSEESATKNDASSAEKQIQPTLKTETAPTPKRRS
jgi:sporulation protein YlmC with PRC-barrel domain